MHGDQFTVTSLSDSGPGTLRQAMQSAQTYDFIVFDPSLSGTIALQTSLPTVSAAYSIVGPTSGLVTVDGQSMNQIFNVTASGASISNLFLSNGMSLSNGGVLNLGSGMTLSLTNVYIAPCSSTGCNMPVFVRDGATLNTDNVSFATMQSGSSVDIFLGGSTYVLDTDLASMPALSIDGSGTIVKEGSGTVQLIAPNSSTDIALQVNDGTLVFTGTLTEPAIVGTAGTLMGSHSVLYLVNNGVVAPGNSIGTISVTGDYNQSGVLQIDIAPDGTSDLLQVGGNAFLGGPLVLTPAQTSAYFKGTKFSFLTVGGAVNGSFSSVTSVLPGVRYKVNDLGQLLEIELLNNVISWSGEPFFGNAAIVKTVIENADVVPGSDLANVIEQLVALDPPSPLETALNQLHPGLFGALAWNDASLMHQVSGRCASSRLCQKDCGRLSEQNGVWTAGLADIVWQNDVGQLRGFRTTSGGVVVGLDGTLADETKLGLAGAYTHTVLTWHDGAGKAIENSGYLTLYSATCFGRTLLDFSLLGNYDSYDSTRNIVSLGRTATSAPQQYGLLAHAGANVFFPTESYGTYAPFGKLDYMSVWRASFDETGADSMTLSVRSGRGGFVRAEAGVSVQWDGCFSWGMLVPKGSVGWVYLTPVSGTNISGRFAGIPTDFTVEMTDRGVNEAAISGSLGIVVDDRVWVEAAYAGEFSPQRIEQDLSASVRWQF